MYLIGYKFPEKNIFNIICYIDGPRSMLNVYSPSLSLEEVKDLIYFNNKQFLLPYNKYIYLGYIKTNILLIQNEFELLNKYILELNNILKEIDKNSTEYFNYYVRYKLIFEQITSIEYDI